MKQLFILPVLLLMATLLQATTFTQNFDGTDFSTAVGTGYANSTFSPAGFPASFAITNGLRNGTTAQDGFAGALGSFSIRLRDAAGSKLAVTVANGGVGTFSFFVRRWDNTPDPNYTLRYSTNGGGAWTNVATINNALLGSSNWLQVGGTINSSNPNIIIEIFNVSGERLMVDNFEMTDYAPVGGACTITGATLTNVSSCNDNGTPTVVGDDYFTADLVVNYANAPAIGSLSYTTATGGGSITVAAIGATTNTFTGLTFPANGLAQSVTVAFSNDVACTLTNANAHPGMMGCSVAPSGGCAPDLFFSEYIEFGNEKYLEIYNGTGATVTLSDYQVVLYANGGVTATTTYTLSGTLVDGGTLVLRNSGSTAFTGTSTSATVVNFNGDDAVALFKISSASNIDIFGRIGEDPGTAWTAAGGYSTEDRTLRRRDFVLAGVGTNPSAGFPTLATQWIATTPVVYNGLGSHTINCAACQVTGVSVSNVSACNSNGTGDINDDFYTADVTVTYSNPELVGTLDLSGDATASVAVGGLNATSHTFSAVQFPADGSAISLTAAFSNNAFCTFSNANAYAGQGSCSVIADQLQFTTVPSSVDGGEVIALQVCATNGTTIQSNYANPIQLTLLYGNATIATANPFTPVNGCAAFTINMGPGGQQVAFTATSTGLTSASTGAIVVLNNTCESFANVPTPNSVSYANYTWTGDNGASWTATDARNDQSISGRAITLRNGSLSVAGLSGGIGTLSFDYARVFSGNSTLQVLVNGTPVGAPIAVTDVVAQTASITVNLTGVFSLEFANTGSSTRTIIDNVCWTSYTVSPPPANDGICQARTLVQSRHSLGNGITCSSRVDNIAFATSNVADPALSCASGPVKSLWYRFTAPDCMESGNAAFTLKVSTDNAGTQFDTKLAVFSSSDGTCNGTLTEIACNDDKTVAGCSGSSNLASSTVDLTASLMPGQVYFVLLSGDVNALGNAEITFSVEPDAPTVSLNPVQPNGLVNVSWTNVNAPSYLVYWRAQGSTGYAMRSSSTTSYANPATAPLVPNTTYDFWVASVCGSSTLTPYNSPVASITTASLNSSCTAPQISCGTTTANTVTIEWPQVTSAIRIGARFFKAGQTGYTQRSSIAYTSASGTSSFTFTGLLENETYTFTLFAECDGRILWSTPITCTTGSSQPRLSNPLFSFVYDGTEYVDVNMNDFDFFAPAAGLPDHVVNVASGQLEVSFVQANEEALSFTLTPSVTNHTATMTVFTSKAADANLSIYDLNGNLVHTEALGEINNAQQVKISAENLTNGIYFVHLRTANELSTQKLVVVK
jgi:hypothetical protein